MTVRPACEYQPACPGCPRFLEPDLDPEAVAVLREVAQAFDLSEPLQYPCEGLGHRHRARLSVRGRPGSLELGIFEAGSHRLVPIVRCPVHHPKIAELLPLLVDWLNETRVEPYDEVAHTGLLRAVQLAVSPESGLVQLVYLVRDDLLSPEPLVQRMLGFAERYSSRLVGTFLGALPQKNNSLLAERIVQVSGEATLTDSCAGARVYFPPDAFGQANPVHHERAVRVIHDHVPEGAKVVEYYAGVGTIGLGLLGRAGSLTINEVGGGSLEGLRLALAASSQKHQVTVLEGRAGDFADAYDADCVVIVDPPRKGLDAALLRRILREPPERLIYLSCGLDAFSKEALELHSSGHFELIHLSGWAYFPFTRHVETLAVWVRKDSAKLTKN